MDRMRAWLSETSTKAGLMTIASAATGYLMGGMSLAAAVSAAAAGVIGLVFPDNQAAAAKAPVLARDLLDLVEAVRRTPGAPSPPR